MEWVDTCVLYGDLLIAPPVAGPSEHLCRLCVSIVTEQAAPTKGQWLLAMVSLEKEMYAQKCPS